MLKMSNVTTASVGNYAHLICPSNSTFRHLTEKNIFKIPVSSNLHWCVKQKKESQFLLACCDVALNRKSHFLSVVWQIVFDPDMVFVADWAINQPWQWLKRISCAEQEQSLLKDTALCVVTTCMGDCHMFGFLLRFLYQVRILCRLCKSPVEENVNQGAPCIIRIYMQTDHICMLKSCSPLMSELGGLWKHWNNPPCSKGWVTVHGFK